MIEVKHCDSCKYINICKNYEQRNIELLSMDEKFKNLFSELPEWASVHTTSAYVRCSDYRHMPSQTRCGECKIKTPSGKRYYENKFECSYRRGYFTKAQHACEHFAPIEVTP